MKSTPLFTATTDVFADVEQAFALIGAPVVTVFKKETPCSYIAFCAFVCPANLLRLDRIFKTVNFVLTQKYIACELVNTIDRENATEAHFAFVVKKSNIVPIDVLSRAEPLQPFEFFGGISTTTGDLVKFDFNTTPHLLIAGASGSGKTTFLNSIIKTFVTIKNDDLLFSIVDLKKIDFQKWDDPKFADNFAAPIATSYIEARRLILGLARYIDIRYSDMRQQGLTAFKGTKWVLIVDELAELINKHDHTIENALVKIAQMGRACGIHLILATQRPTVDVCTGAIKANIPCRLAFKCASKIDSRVILDINGAENLIGKGDALYRDHFGNVTNLQCLI